MGGAVEMCSGLGACRKKLDGTMCPSYMATREESALDARPRQRAAAGDGRAARRAGARRRGRPRGARPLPRMPRLQGRVPGRRRRGAVQERVPRRLLAAARHAAARAGASATSTTSSQMGQPLRAALELRRRAARRPLDQRTAARHRSPPDAAGMDAANRSRSSSRVAQPARRVQRAQPPVRSCCSTTPSPIITIRRSAWRQRTCSTAAGAAVRLAPHVCCGRPLISQGLLDEARALAATERRGACTTPPRAASRIVFLEPSCLSAVREDAPALLRGDAQRKRAGSSPARACCSRSISKREWQRGALTLPLERRSVDRAAARPLSSEVDGPGRAGARAAVAHSRRRRSSISTPAAAAWPARSATAASTTTSRGTIGERKLLPAARAMQPATVLVARRHVVPRSRWRTSPASRPPTPRCCCDRLSGHGARVDGATPWATDETWTTPKATTSSSGCSA